MVPGLRCYTHHVTVDHGNLSIHSEHQGHAHLQVGNGSGLRIANIGSSSLRTSSSSLKLHNVLHVPHITKNLLSISQLTKDNNVCCEFHVDDFFIKDRGKTKGGLHRLPVERSTK